MVEFHVSNQTTSPTTGSGPTADCRLRPGAKALVQSSDSVLLVKEYHADGTPFWTLPGGGVQPTETSHEALQRELAEELGCRGAIREPVATVYYAHHSCSRTVSAYRVFDCRLLDPPVPNTAEGIRAVRWVGPESPPAHTLPQVRWLLRTHCW